MLFKKRKQDKNKKRKKVDYLTQHFAFVLFAIVIIFLIVGYVVVYPVYSDYKSLSDETVANKKINLNKEQQIFSELWQLNKTYNEISPILKDKVIKLLPESQELPSLYYNLDQLANQAGFKLQAIGVHIVELDNKKNAATADKDKNEELATRELREIEVNLELSQGGYATLKNFLSLVEKNLRIFDVKSFIYNPEKEQIEVVLKTYFY